MNANVFVDPVFSGRMCQTLLHSVWQIALLALATWAIDRLWRKRSVERSYALQVVALFAALAAMPLTYVLIDPAQTPIAVLIQTASLAPDSSQTTRVEAFATGSAPAAQTTVAESGRTATEVDISATSLVSNPAGVSSGTWSTEKLSRPWPQIAPWILGLYVVGVAVMFARLILAIVKANQLGYRARPITDGPLIAALRSLAGKWSMTVVPALAQAEQIVVPQIVGLIRPTILLPASAISGLSIEDLEMILAHELAHVRRHDMWVNLLQRVAETFLFFNPALWYLSRHISTLREYCCDEATCRMQSASVCEPHLRYAAALLRVAELSRPASSADLAILSASGRSPSELRRRVARLFGEPLREPLRFSRGGVLTLIASAIALAIGPTVWTSRAHTAVGQDDMPRQFRLNVVDPDGSSVANASVEIRTSPAITANQIQRGKFVQAGTYGTFATTDEEGRLALTLPRRPERFEINIKQAGYGPYWASWDAGYHPQAMPDEFTAELDKAWSVGGVVVDANGNAVKNVEVNPRVYYKKRPGDTDRLGVGTRIRTDSDGRWRFDSVPVSMSEIHIEVSHPDYQPLRQRLPRNGFEVQQDSIPTGRIELNRGLTVTGTVTDESGQPIEGALVRTKFLNDIREARTDTTGVYRLVGCEPRMARIVASAKGRATDMQEVRVDPDLKPVNFSMKPGGQIRIRVVDEQGQGIPKARIFFQRWRGRIDYFEFAHVSQFADENGVWQWNEAPLDGFQADICRPDGMQLSKQSLIARDEEYVFTPPRALVVSGSVVDAKTKKPIDKFRVIPGLRNSDPGIRMNWIPGDSYEASNGDYRIRLTHAYPAHLVRIEAEGYMVAISRDIMTDEGEVDVDFELHAAEDIAATILTATGEPAGLAKVALGVAGSQISINRGDIDAGSTDATQLDSDVDGRFSIPARDEPFQIVITHPAGFAYLRSVDGPIPRRIRLTPWARVEGTFRVGADPAPNVVLSMVAEGIHSYGDDVPNIFTHHDVTTGKDGRFVFERVFPGKGRIGRRILLMVDDGATEVTSSQRVSAEFIAAQTTTLALGGTGRPVVGKLAPPADHAERVLWNFALINVRADVNPPPPPPAPAEVQNDPAKRQAWWDAWKETKAGKGWTYAYEAYEQIRSASPVITASVDRDGSFRIDDVPQGAYVLSVRFSKESPGALSGYRFSVAAVEQRGATDRVELGTLTLDRQ